MKGKNKYLTNELEEMKYVGVDTRKDQSERRPFSKVLSVYSEKKNPIYVTN